MGSCGVETDGLKWRETLQRELMLYSSGAAGLQQGFSSQVLGGGFCPSFPFSSELVL